MSQPIYFEGVIGAEHLDLQDCVMRFKESMNNHLLRVILYKLKNVLNYYVYTKTSYPDKSELWALYEDTLMRCIELYDVSLGSTFKTYFIKSLENTLINLYRKKDYKDMYSLRFEYEEDGEEDSINDTLSSKVLVHYDSYDLDEKKDLLNQLRPLLSDNEYIVCKAILFNQKKKILQKDLSKRTGLTISSVSTIIKRLQDKYNNGTFKEIFFKTSLKTH